MPSPEDPRYLQREDIGDVTVVRLSIPVVHASDKTFFVFREVYHVVEHDRRTRIVVNFSGTPLLNSTMYGFVFSLMKKVLAANGHLALCHIPNEAEAFLSSFPDPPIDIYATEQEALQAVRDASGDAR